MVGIMGHPPLSKLCSPNYLTLENEILTSFLPFFLLSLGRVWVESPGDHFGFKLAPGQITAHSPKEPSSQESGLKTPGTWGWQENCSCRALVSFLFFRLAFV